MLTAKEERKLYRESHKEQIKASDRAYREVNREILAEKSKQYYQKNKEAISAKKKADCEANTQISEKFDCACGGRFAHRHFSTHAKTDQHVKFVSSLNGSPLPPAVLSPVQQKPLQTREERLATMREAHRLRMSDATYREKEYQLSLIHI